MNIMFIEHQHKGKYISTNDTERFLDTKAFRLRYRAGASTQALWRKKGMPFYRVPNAKKILYKEAEVTDWITSQKNVFIGTK